LAWTTQTTQAERFAIVGGSCETHERMTETVIKTFETLDRRGKTLDQVEQQELAEIIHKNTPNK
jgi:cell division ATPase FtsA